MDTLRAASRVLLLGRIMVALTLGLAFAHVLEFFGKLQLPARDWLVVQHHLYVAFGAVGGPIEVLAIVLTWAGWILLRRTGPAPWTLAAAVAVTIGLIDWALVVSPMNGVLNGWTPASVPGEWTAVRNRWEVGHAVQAVLFAVGFVCLELDAYRRRSMDEGLSGRTARGPGAGPRRPARWSR